MIKQHTEQNTQKSNKHMTIIYEMQIKLQNTYRYHFIPTGWQKLETQDMPSGQRAIRTLMPGYCRAWRWVQPFWSAIWHSLSQIKFKQTL